MKTYRVRIWKLSTNGSGNPMVRWRTEDRTHSQSFRNVPLADSFRSELVSASRAGEAFDVDTGLPMSMVKASRGAGRTWLDLTIEYVERKWPEQAANSRTSTAEALAVVTPALVRTRRGQPDADVLRAALYGSIYNLKNRGRPVPDEQDQALAWLRRTSVPVAALAEEPDLLYAALDALARKRDGTRAAANTIRRKRAVFYNALGYAVASKLLPANPLDTLQWTLPKAESEIDERVVASPKQVKALLAAVAAQGPRGRHLMPAFACMYYGLMRPAEVVDLTRAACDLPKAVPDATVLEAPADGAVPDDAYRLRQGAAWVRLGGRWRPVRDAAPGRCIVVDEPDRTAVAVDLDSVKAGQRIVRGSGSVRVGKAPSDWGVLHLAGSQPRVGSAWTDDGTTHERRQLKHRARHAVRSVDIPPELVAILRDHIEGGLARDEYLFRAVRGGPVHESEYGEIWANARAAALSPGQVASPLAKRPYDLRHAGVSFLLQSGVDPAEIARRAGHSVNVLLKFYAKVVFGTRARSNRRIQEALEDAESADEE